MTLIVIVDRDPVAAGDDASPHGDTWEFDDDARIGDVVAQIVEHRYVPMLKSDVTWGIELDGSATLHRGSDGTVEWTSPGDHVRRVGQLLCSKSGPPGWIQLDPGLTARTHLIDSRTRLPTGEFVVRARYSSSGRLRSWDEFRVWLAESDEDEQRRYARERHEKWPQYFDEDGNRYPA